MRQSHGEKGFVDRWSEPEIAKIDSRAAKVGINHAGVSVESFANGTDIGNDRDGVGFEVSVLAFVRIL